MAIRWKGRTIMGLIIGLIFGGMGAFFVMNKQVQQLKDGEIAQHESSTVITDSTAKEVEYLLRETFDENVNDWQEYLKDYGMKLLYDGKYIMRYSKKDFFIWSTIEIPDLPLRYDVELVARFKTGSENAVYGLMLNQDKDNYNRFSISASGYATINMKKEGKWQSDVISNLGGFDNAEDPDLDRLKVEVRGEKYRFFVNDRLVKDGFVKFDWKYLGTFVSDEQTVEFDELTIVKID